jgi:NADPH2:quinone reductase
MVKVIRIHKTGGPEVLTFEDAEVGDPPAGQVRLRQTAIGLNYADVYQRTGMVPLPSFPSGLGSEGAGVVEAIGPNVTEVKVGQRVAYAGAPIGGYAEKRFYPANRLIPLPDSIDDITAASMMMQGMTAEYLIRRCYPVKKGDTILVHAAAGGVGSIMCQWAKHLGATVIGTVGSDEKAKAAKANGVDHPIVYTREKFLERVKEITGGKGVPVVYDSIGKDTWEGSLDCLSPRGLMVSFGNASGPVPPFAPGILSAKGSLYVTRPQLGSYVITRDDLLACAQALFDVVQKGAVKVGANQKYAFKDVAQAHKDMESRKTTGSSVLIP